MSYTNRGSNIATAKPSTSNILYRELDSSTNSVMYTRDWRTALRTPPSYRIGNRTVRFNNHFALFIFAISALFLLFYYVHAQSKSSSDFSMLKSMPAASSTNSINSINSISAAISSAYNATYPLTSPLVARTGSITYRIAMVADLDTNSKVLKSDGSTVWRSYLKKGLLTYAAAKSELKVAWDASEPIALESSFALKDRGMELSELVTFNGKLLSVDDRTGLVYELTNDKPLPWIILLDGDGHNSKGFKAEWATVKQQQLYVGSMGKEWTTGTGEFENFNPMFVKVISTTGEVRSLDWSYNYKQLRQLAKEISWPGYMIHESGAWSEQQQKWYFLPRRCSQEKYNETRDEHMGCNVLIAANEDFTKIDTVQLEASNTKATHGFSSFKFIPNTEDRLILAIKSEELNGKTCTFITAFDINGKTLLPEQQVDTNYKYEGIEFI